MTKLTIQRPSVASLLLQLQFKGTPLATATGFVALSAKGQPMLMTNRHNVTGRHHITGTCLHSGGGVPDQVVISHNVKNKLAHWIDVTEDLLDSQGNPRWLEHPKLGAKADFVALPLATRQDIELYPYNPSAPGADIQVGPAEAVSIVGFPFGKTGGGRLGIWVTGFVASEPAVDFEGSPTFLVDSRTRQGQSGSPVIAFRTGSYTTGSSLNLTTGSSERFLGMYSGRLNAESDLGVVWKVNALAELLAAH